VSDASRGPEHLAGQPAAGPPPGEADQAPASRGLAGRQRSWLSRRGGWALALAAVLPVAIGTMVTTPAGHRVTTLASRLTAEAKSLWQEAAPAQRVLQQAKPFGGTPPVGALFTTTGGGKLGSHFCTASVVDSPDRDILITAAHCVGNTKPDQILFVPGFHNGRAPYGVWRITRVVVDSSWTAAANPDDDFAFLVVAAGPGGRRVQDVTGGERLGRSLSLPARQLVQVVGYPDAGAAPISCVNRVIGYSSSQLEFNCGGYTDGTSGGPLLRNVSPSTGLGTVIGVIGGYEQGGDTASVSYAARFGPNVAALYETATR
jgi:V8-like Glu-specific endopeptidase